MLKISFKNVGQGDSIILEWKNKIGIIDCCKHGNQNPILDHVKITSEKEIEFVILSHLHFDHYSGLLELLDYLESKQKRINFFYYSFSSEIVQVIGKLNSQIKKNYAHNLIKKIDKLDGNILSNVLRIDCNRNNIILNDNLYLNILSPNEKDYRKLSSQIGNYINSKKTTYPDINRVATILKIVKNDEEYILLTSDALGSSLNRIKGFLPDNQTLKLCQVPHHGSLGNHKPNIWSSVNKVDNAPAVFSVGFEPKDKLPKKVVVDDFVSFGYKIHSTNQVYGIEEKFGKKLSTPKKINEISQLLGISQINQLNKHNDNLNGDQSFELW